MMTIHSNMQWIMHFIVDRKHKIIEAIYLFSKIHSLMCVTFENQRQNLLR